MNDPHDLLSRVIAEVQRQKLTPGDVAEKADLSLNAVKKVLAGRCRRPTWDTVAGIALAIGMRIEFTPMQGVR